MSSANLGIIKPAGFWIRLLANILDIVIVSVPVTLVSYVIFGTPEGNPIINLISVFYSLLLPIYWSGYTVGKKIVGIRIVKVDGEKLGIGAMLLRTLVSSIVYGLTLGIAVIVSAFMVAFRQDKRAIHDLIAGTYVTFEKLDQAPDGSGK